MSADDKHDIEIHPNQFPDRLFRPHGNYVARANEQIIRSETTGPLNRELILSYQRAALPLWKSIAEKGPFAVLAILKGSMMMTTDAFDQFIVATRELSQHVPAFTAIAQLADPELEGRALMIPLYRNKVYGPLNIPYECFSEEAQAMEWLNAQLEAKKSAD